MDTKKVTDRAVEIYTEGCRNYGLSVETKVARVFAASIIEALAEAEAEARHALCSAAKPLRFGPPCDPHFEVNGPATPRLPPTPDSYYNGKPR